MDEKQLEDLAAKVAGQIRARQGTGKTLRELAESWLKRIVRVEPRNEQRHLGHLEPVLGLTEGELTKARVEEVLNSLLTPVGTLSTATVNKVRNTGRQVIRDAQANGDWYGHNPFELVRRQREAIRLYTVLTRQEFAKVLPHLNPARRRFMKTIFFTGLRPGEAFGLKKNDVDLDRRMLCVRRSHGRSQTKTGKEREFPIPDAVVEDLRAAIEVSPSEYVFPRRDGTRQRADTKMTRTLRAAMKSAGLVTGYRYRCRNRSCDRVDEVRSPPRATNPDCPACGWRLWVSPIAKSLRFYDLRHSSNTAHRKAGADAVAVKVMMGHAALDVNDDRYTHFDESFMRRELNKLTLPTAAELFPEEEQERRPVVMSKSDIEARSGMSPDEFWFSYFALVDEHRPSPMRPDDCCWRWKGSTNEDGRPVARVGESMLPAAELAWAYAGWDSDDEEDERPDMWCAWTPDCIRPNHLVCSKPFDFLLLRAHGGDEKRAWASWKAWKHGAESASEP